MIPRMKKIMYVIRRPMKSDIDAQKMRPAMLKMLKSPTNPAAAAADPAIIETVALVPCGK